MSLNNFIPEVWSTQVLEALPAQLVFAALCNGDYEGDISKMGDTVRISGIGDITVSSYVKDTTIGTPQVLSDAQTALTISQAKFYNFAVDDVDKAQGNPAVMGAAMRWAAYSLAKQADLFVAGLYTDVAAVNTIGTSAVPVVLTRATNTNIAAGTTLYDELVVLAQLLTQSNVPNDGGRFAVIPAWGKTLLTQDYRFTAFNTPSADRTISTGALDPTQGPPPAGGYIGQIENMAIWESNNAPHLGGTLGVTGSQDVFLAGHKMAWSFAANVKETEAYRPPDKFGDAVKGLYLYGAKVVRPYALSAGFFQMPV